MKFNLKLFWTVFFLSLIASLLIGIRLVFFKPNSDSIPPKANPLEKIKIGQAEFWVEIADTTAKRSRGLSGRPSLPENQGILFVFEEEAHYSFWMKDTLIPLDFIWIRDNRIVEITTNVSPENHQSPKTLKPNEKVDMVLELNAGAARKFNLSLDQEIEF